MRVPFGAAVPDLMDHGWYDMVTRAAQQKTIDFHRSHYSGLSEAAGSERDA